jgi:hypothetical protein
MEAVPVLVVVPVPVPVAVPVPVPVAVPVPVTLEVTVGVVVGGNAVGLTEAASCPTTILTPQTSGSERVAE